MNHPFIYVGCFVKPEELRSTVDSIRKEPLRNDIKSPHITFEYKPEKVDRSLFGKMIHIKIVGYGNDGQNEGLKVQLESDDPSIMTMIDRIEVPHITLSISDDGKSVDTKNLSFYDIDPIEMDGKYGGFANWGKVIF